MGEGLELGGGEGFGEGLRRVSLFGLLGGKGSGKRERDVLSSQRLGELIQLLWFRGGLLARLCLGPWLD